MAEILIKITTKATDYFIKILKFPLFNSVFKRRFTLNKRYKMGVSHFPGLSASNGFSLNLFPIKNMHERA